MRRNGNELITVFGGTGFLGRCIVSQLAADGKRVRVAVRHPGAGHGEAAEHIRCDVRDETTLGPAVTGARAVVNAVGLYLERGEATFEAVHVQGALQVARQANKYGVERLVHVSGIGADRASPSRYVRARYNGETRVRETFEHAIIVRPSVLFGPGDSFLYTLDRITHRLPVIPLFGAGATRLQPVYVEDVADAIARCLKLPTTPGKTFELAGPEIYAYRQLVEIVLRYRRRRRLLLPLPFPVWKLAARLLSVLPAPPFTRDQIALMRRDNVAGEAAAKFVDLGITPAQLQDLLPRCLG